MNRLPIFAGLDSSGQIRFVGDVPRGAACGCRCVACGSPLVSRRGDVRTWHFAHEASQERPECFSGAVNLLRRVAIERLKASGLPPLPAFKTTVYARAPLPHLQEVVEWAPGACELEEWLPQPSHHAPVARLRLASGTKVHLFVEVSDSPSVRLPSMPPDDGIAILCVPLPTNVEDFKDLGTVGQYIDSAWNFVWARLPDARARIEEVLRQVEMRATRLRDERQALWRMGGYTPPQAPPPSPVPATAPRASVTVEVDESPWAAWRKPRSAFLFYGLKDGSAWVLFARKEGGHVMAPWPEQFEGWDEAMPAKIGEADLDRGVYVLRDQTQTMIFLGALSRKITTASTWVELIAIEWQGAPQ